MDNLHQEEDQILVEMIEVGVVVDFLEVEIVKCIKLLVVIVEKTVKYLLDQQVVNQFIALIVLKKWGIEGQIDQKGQMHKVEVTMDREYRSYSVWRSPVDTPDLNIAILPKGVCVTIVEDGRLSVFVPSTGTLKNIQDKQVTTGMTLTNLGDRVVYVEDGAVWAMEMK